MEMTAKETRPRTPVAVMICWSMPTTTVVASRGRSLLTVLRASGRTAILFGLSKRAAAPAKTSWRCSSMSALVVSEAARDFQRAVESKAKGDRASARRDFLRAAEGLMLAAGGSRGKLRETRKALAEAVRATKDYEGLTGMLTCSATGECAAASVLFMQVQNGEWVKGPGQ